MSDSNLVRFAIAATVAAALSLAPPPCCRAAGCPGVPRGAEVAVLLFQLEGGGVLCESGGELVRRKFFGTSIYKPLAAYALLKEKVVSPGETTVAQKEVFVARYGAKIKCPYAISGRKFDLQEAVAQSDNCYFYLMGQRLSPATWKKYYGDFGLAGCVDLPDGPKEMAEFPAHGGRAVRASAVDLIPYIIKLAGDPSPEMGLVRRAMEMAVKHGTARAAQLRDVDICGKTGWLNGVGQFIAFAPAAQPEVGLVVTVPGSDGARASQVGGGVLRAWFGGKKTGESNARGR